MSHFLSGLLDRAEGRAPVLERRARALFESRNDGDGRPVESLEQDETRVSPPAPAQHVRFGDADASPVRLRDVPPRHEHIEQIRNPRTPDPESTRPPDRPSPSHQRGTLVPVDVPQVRARSTPQAGIDRPAPLPLPLRTDSKREGGEPPQTITKIVEGQRAPERAASRAEPSVGEAARTPRARRTPEASPIVKQTTKIIEHSRTPRSPVSPVNRSVPSESAVRLAKAQTPTAARRERSAAASAAPVQITIGRVEVRAVPGRSERAPINAPASPRLSLDEYLRRRTGDAT